MAATEMMWVMLSFQTLEQLTNACGGSSPQYSEWMKRVLAQTVVGYRALREIRDNEYQNLPTLRANSVSG
ncbi:hypothetical protein [Profundibacter sp.]